MLSIPLTALLLASTAWAAPGPKASDPGPKPPAEHDVSYAYDLLYHTLVRPATRAFDPALLVRKIAHHPREAANVDEKDQVRMPSTWWTPRIGFRPVTVEQMMNGPGTGQGPADGKWTITKAKSQGVTPGFQIKDSNGDAFILKFDPPKYPEMNSTDVIGSYLFWAAGYNVPENTIAYFRAENLDIDPKATYMAGGTKMKMTKQYLAHLLSKAVRDPDGRYRCMASRYLKGKPLGPFDYNGRREDDPEDLIPHELRRELRGLWVMAAWTNHSDARSANTLDMWTSENGRSFVRHYLIDFGSILGSSGVTPHMRSTGFEYYADYGVMAKQTLTLGLTPFVWEEVVDPDLPSVGFVESEKFDPAGWRPDYPNPAFDDRTDRDIRWGATIVAGFTDDHIRAAVNAAHYTDPRATEYLVHTLIERRNKIVARWLGPNYVPSYASAR
jgi:hypothetical protein